MESAFATEVRHRMHEEARRRQKAAADSLGGRCVHGVNLYQDMCAELDCLNAVNQALANQDRFAESSL